MHFLGQAFPTEKGKFCLFFFYLTKKPSALKNIQNFKTCKKSQCENSQISKSSKKQLNLLLEYTTLDVFLYQVLRVGEQL